jgi:N-methylhydantoinase A
VEDGFVDSPTYERSLLPLGAEIAGPSVIEQPDTTVWLEPGSRARVGEAGNLIVEVE